MARRSNFIGLPFLAALATVGASCSGPSHQHQHQHQHQRQRHRHATRPATRPATTAPTPPAQSSTTTTELLFGQSRNATPAFFGAPEGPPCAPSQLTLQFGGFVSEKTEQHSVGITLTNSSNAACHMIGYPGIVFVDAVGDDLPLIYLRGGDQMVTYQPPRMVDLPPESAAYVLLNQNACVGRQVDEASGLRLIPPNTTGTLTLPATVFPLVASCQLGDPGNTLTISPVEPTAAGTFSLTRPVLTWSPRGTPV